METYLIELIYMAMKWMIFKILKQKIKKIIQFNFKSRQKSVKQNLESSKN